jgi:hypothetical protein
VDLDLIEVLLHMSEGDTLDFKREQYPLAGATEAQKAELIKDVLAFANAWKNAFASSPDNYAIPGALVSYAARRTDTKKPPKQFCPVPGCKNPAAPVFGMVCAKHKDVAKAKIKKYREARKAKKLGIKATAPKRRIKKAVPAKPVTAAKPPSAAA